MFMEIASDLVVLIFSHAKQNYFSKNKLEDLLQFDNFFVYNSNEIGLMKLFTSAFLV